MKNEEKVIVIVGKAPIWDRVKETFPAANERTTIIAYGDKIYAPEPLPGYMIAHELVHCERQGFTKKGADAWWEKYFVDPKFRLAEEIPAYQAQYQEFLKLYKDRNTRTRFTSILATQLSGDLYGHLIDYISAWKVITDKNYKVEI